MKTQVVMSPSMHAARIGIAQKVDMCLTRPHLSACTVCVSYIILIALCHHQIACVIGSHVQACYDSLRQPLHVTCSGVTYSWLRPCQSVAHPALSCCQAARQELCMVQCFVHLRL